MLQNPQRLNEIKPLLEFRSVFIPKGKPTNGKQAWRPICVEEVILMVLHKLVKDHLMTWFCGTALYSTIKPEYQQ